MGRLDFTTGNIVVPPPFQRHNLRLRKHIASSGNMLFEGGETLLEIGDFVPEVSRTD